MLGGALEGWNKYHDVQHPKGFMGLVDVDLPPIHGISWIFWEIPWESVMGYNTTHPSFGALGNNDIPFRVEITRSKRHQAKPPTTHT